MGLRGQKTWPSARQASSLGRGVPGAWKDDSEEAVSIAPRAGSGGAT